jgi:hypothetical protein
VTAGAKREAYAAGEFFPYRGPDRPVFGAILCSILRSPIGAMWGLALLVLLWLSGCA